MNENEIKTFVKENISNFKKFANGSPYDGETISYNLGNLFVVTCEEFFDKSSYQLRYKNKISEDVLAKTIFDFVDKLYKDMFEKPDKDSDWNWRLSQATNTTLRNQW